MTRGVLIFAFDTDLTDYVGMATWCAKNVQKHLDLPVSLVTNRSISNSTFDQVICTSAESGNYRFFPDYNQTAVWFNSNRTDAYSLSPYDQTLVIDADLVVCSDNLQQLFNSREHVLCHQQAYDVTGNNKLRDSVTMGRNGMPMSWATVLYFDRSTHSRLVFEMLNMIKQNWDHYRLIYGIASPSYRNDYALTIALNTLNGHQGRHSEIPWALASVTPDNGLTQINQDCYRVDYTTNENKRKYVILNRQDFHAMGKLQLGEIIANQR
jgi:hypothetical protein